LPAGKEGDSDLKVLKIGQQAREIDFSSGAQQGGIAEIKEMMDRMHDLPVARQYPILSLASSTAYYRAQEFSEADLVLMRRIDALHLEHLFADSRMGDGSVSWTDPLSTA
jgi:hypothetical protein